MSHLLVITFLLMPIAVGITDINTACGDEPQFRITTKRDSDKVEVTIEQDKAVISIRSPLGLSQAVIQRSDRDWPSTVVLRLHLQGLENFKLTYGKVILEAALSSQNGKARLWKDEKEDLLLDATTSYWMEIRMIDKDGNPVKTIPLKDGYFEMQLPQAVIADNPQLITLSWIDFYR